MEYAGKSALAFFAFLNQAGWLFGEFCKDYTNGMQLLITKYYDYQLIIELHKLIF